jgi:uncharacterized membrane protein (DUF373 family)
LNTLIDFVGRVAGSAGRKCEATLDDLLVRVQKWVVIVLAAMLIVVIILSTIDLGFLVGEEMWKAPHFLIPVHGLVEIFGFFLLVLIGVEILETLKAYLKKDVIHLHVVLEVALIAMARKVILAEPDTVSAPTLFGIAALILALAVAVYLERPRKAKVQSTPANMPKISV